MIRRGLAVTVGLATIAALASAAIAVRRDVDAAWAAMAVRLDELQAEREAEPRHRRALHGETTDGSAWPHYTEALRIVHDLDLDVRRMRALVATVGAPSDADRASRGELLLEAAPALELLRLGAHARDATAAIDWSRGAAARIPRIIDARWLSQLALLRAQELMEQGACDRAVAVVLDPQQLGGDLACSHCMIVELIGLDRVAAAEVCDWLSSGALAALPIEDRRRLHDGLAALEASLPRGSGAMRGELEFFGRTMQNTLDGSKRSLAQRMHTLGGADLRVGWRHRFSWQHAASDWVVRGSDLAREIEAAYDAPNGEIAALLDGIQDRAEADPNPLFEVALPRLSSVATARQNGLARLALLRHALALHLGLAARFPADSFGSDASAEVTDELVRVRTQVPGHEPIEVTLPR